jgi:hypothetical protein
MLARWIARLLLVRSLWSGLGRGGRRFLCGCLVLLVLLVGRRCCSLVGLYVAWLRTGRIAGVAEVGRLFLPAS